MVSSNLPKACANVAGTSNLRRRCGGKTQKKSRRFRRLLKLITGRRQTEWTGATRCPNEDNASHIRETLINRKREISFRLCLPCRPLAEVADDGPRKTWDA